MKSKNKNHHQSLNPFLGFGWYTGVNTVRNRFENKFKSSSLESINNQ